ncbi:hypothetical protein NS07_v2contig00121-0001 [Nocardia seriolae]|nr:hypothetical protein NS07_v2contig00121-0001 [Nocardia seriolae]
MDPCEVRMPHNPWQAAGIRIDPAVSVPSPISASPRATATADPLEDPPGTHCGAAGFTGIPYFPFPPVML